MAAVRRDFTHFYARMTKKHHIFWVTKNEAE
jgi:hypothetical protein